MRKKQLVTGICAAVGMLVLILDGKTALEGAGQGIELCLRTVIPSLFPFFLLSILLTGSFVGANLPILRPVGRLFRIPKGAESILISAFLGGYPVGAQCIAEACHSGQIEKVDCERMLAFCNNAGPAFLFGMSASMFPFRWMGWALWGIHIVSALCVSILMENPANAAKFQKHTTISLPSAMITAIRVMGTVCGWVIVFRVIIAFLSRWVLWMVPAEFQVLITGILELSNGCCSLLLISDIRLRFLICSVILALGGLCVTMQTISVTRGLSLRQYFTGKLLQTFFSIVLSCSLVFNRWVFPVAFFLFFLFLRCKIRKKSGNPQTIGV